MDVTVRVRASAPDLRSTEGQKPARQQVKRASWVHRVAERLATVQEDEEERKPAPRAVATAADPFQLAGEIDRMIARRRAEYGVNAVLPSPPPRASRGLAKSASRPASGYCFSEMVSEFRPAPLRLRSSMPLLSAPGMHSGDRRAEMAPALGPSPRRHANGMPVYLSPAPFAGPATVAESGAKQPVSAPARRESTFFSSVLGRHVRMGNLLANQPPKADHSKPWSPAQGPLLGPVERLDRAAMPARRSGTAASGMVPAYIFGHDEARWHDAPKKEKEVPVVEGPTWCASSGRRGVVARRSVVEMRGALPALSVSPTHGSGSRAGSAAGTQHQMSGRLGERRHSKGSTASLPSPAPVDSPMAGKADCEGAFATKRPVRYRQSSAQIARRASSADISGASSGPRAPVAGASMPTRHGEGGSSVGASHAPSIAEAYGRLQMLDAACQRFESAMFDVRSEFAARLFVCCARRRDLWCETERLHQQAASLLAHSSPVAAQRACSGSATRKLCEDIAALERAIVEASRALDTEETEAPSVPLIIQPACGRAQSSGPVLDRPVRSERAKVPEVAVQEVDGRSVASQRSVLSFSLPFLHRKPKKHASVQF
ncbi:hypothetical protein LTR73_005994 [Friedmanniomyces endolithicus]|nr:hypothetical protein LTR73_005994 [Friedmanniomyces endolithicus]